MLVLAAAAAACSSCTAEKPTVSVYPDIGPEARLTVEVADSPAERMLGLMYRKALPDDHGMLFIFEREEVHSFTMKNTFIPLDMIFIGSDMRIAGIVENTRPQTSGPYRINEPSIYVLETNAFYCKEHGISEGNHVEFAGVD